MDSTAQFETQLQDAGLGLPLVTSLKTHGVRTLAQLAFTVGQPGQPIADASIEADTGSCWTSSDIERDIHPQESCF